ncbi:hypothetical protein LBMAG53_20260 [Planctomycetota bacterium]|nr:hypothetical protein LBMAG53_20260 [Planctomycetota bacterium]
MFQRFLLLAAAIALVAMVFVAGCSQRGPERSASPTPTPAPGSQARDAKDLTAEPLVNGPEGPAKKKWANLHASAYAASEAKPLAGKVTGGPVEPESRDLGAGSGGEKLGDVVRHREEREGYDGVTDHPFTRASDPGGDASTFGLDVDTASYSNIRRFLTGGQRPPKAAVRIEELVNAFSYGYTPPIAPEPHPFRFAAARAPCPWQPAHRLLRVAVQGRTVGPEARPAMNLVFLVDVSGSMGEPNKLPLVIQTLKLIADRMEARDRIAIVTYAGADRVVLKATAGSERRTISRALDDLSSGGSTNGAGGILRAYAEAVAGRESLRGHDGPVQSRVILCTDGDFNVGVSDPAQLKDLIAEQAKTGVFLNVFGYGTGNYQDRTASAIANRGNGVYSYVDSYHEARRLAGSGLIGQLVTIAQDAKVQVFFNPTTVAGWRQIGYEKRRLNREDFNDDTKDAGDLGAGHACTVLYEIVPTGVAVPAGSDPNPFLPGAQPGATPEHVRGADAHLLCRLRLRYKQPNGGTSQLLEQDVSDQVGDPDGDLRFASAVAGFGMLLRSSPYAGSLTWDQVERLARANRGEDPSGQRSEFIKLVEMASSLAR